MIQIRTAVLLMLLICPGRPTTAQDDDNWVRIQLDERFRSEGVAAADINKNGTLDVISGDVWYEAPPHGTAEYLDPSQWKMHEIRMPGEFVAGVGYSNSFANFVWDIDQDGWQDVVIVGFPGEPFHWYKNPGNTSSTPWKQQEIWSSICNESPEFEDLDGDGSPEFVFGSQPESQMGFTKIPGAASVNQKFGFQAISETGDPHQNGSFKYYHGLGVGDMNGDGHRDVIIGHGWWQSPGQLKDAGLWQFHPIRITTDKGLQPLPAASYIYADDLDLDGDADLFLTSAHGFGVWWAENRGEEPWILHEIDKSFSQTHAVERVDINGDGQLDYVTGKRFFAHNGGDPGAHDPVVMYWFETIRTAGKPPVFKAHQITAGLGTGVGTQFAIHDMNKDGKPDIVLSNKKGVNVLLQK